jgi:hypothetical protein
LCLEEILVLVLQLLGELFLQVLIYLPFEWPRSLRRGGREDPREAGCAWGILYLALGALVGWLSVLVFPRAFLPYVWMQVANLVAAPLACGWTSYAFARWRQARGARTDPPAHFFSGLMFGLAFVVARFLLVRR